MRRVATALVLVPVALAAVLWAPPWLFELLLLGLALQAARELFDLAEASGLAPYRWIGFVGIAGLLVLLSLPGYAWGVRSMAWLIAVLLVTLARTVSRPARMASALGDAGATLLAVLYLGVLLGLLGAIRGLDLGPIWLVFMLAVVWLGDTAALYAGKAVGRHAMATVVSPKKTWEGSVASLVVALVVGVAFGHWFVGARWRTPLLFGGLAVAINIAAQVGDLAESLIKRGAQAKDSGSLLPGHGGVLDRIDAMLLAVPVLWYYLTFLRG